MTDLLATGVDTFPFKGLISRLKEPFGARFSFLFYEYAQHIILMLLYNVAAAIEVSDMVRLFTEAFVVFLHFQLRPSKNLQSNL